MSYKYFSKKSILLGVIVISLSIFVYNTLLSAAPDVVSDNAVIEHNVDSLLNNMTLDEKVGQMVQAARYSVSNSDITNYYLGSLLSGGGSVPNQNTVSGWNQMIDEYQDAANATRLKIPLIYGVDAVHGHNNVKNATIFPHNIGLGATRDIDLVKQIGIATSEEVRATGVNMTFSPCVTVPQDIRWGRTYEGFAENTQLVTAMGSAYLNGLEQDSHKLIGCVKHFIGDGGTDNGINEGNCTYSETEIREKFLPPYIEAINNGAKSVMISFNSIDGVKCHGNYKYVTEILKDELKFDGIVLSDWNGIYQISQNETTAIKTSLEAGIDMFMISDAPLWKNFIATTKQLVNNNEIPMSRIDDAVRRILTVKSEMGLLDNDYVSSGGNIGTDKNRELAREAVRKSLVLLKNENNIIENLKNMNNIFVCGKSADDIGNQCGGWTITWQGMSGNITEGTSILEGIQNEVGNSKKVNYNKNGSGASGNDVAIVVVGETPYAETDGDKTDLGLDYEDIQTINNVKNANIPMIVILISGRPMIITDEINDFDGFIAGWLPGTEGSGISDVLFGEYDFTGKLPFTWPKNVNNLHNDPLFEYGFGLTKNIENSPLPSTTTQPSSTIEPSTTTQPSSTIEPSTTTQPSSTIQPSPSKPANSPNNAGIKYTIINDWGNGSTISIDIENTGSSEITSWKLNFDFDGNQKITNLWNAKYTQSGNSVSITNEVWNGKISASSKITIGFNLSYSGTNNIPENFTLTAN